jgi:hypothetical protein
MTKCLPLIIMSACVCSTALAAQTVLVQLVNGRSGKPVGKDKSVHVVFDTGQIRHLLNLHTDAQGIVEFDAQGAKEFKVAPVEYAPCDQPASAATKDYSVADITNDGLVTFNDCAQSSPQPVPGRLIYLVKPGSRWSY